MVPFRSILLLVLLFISQALFAEITIGPEIAIRSDAMAEGLRERQRKATGELLKDSRWQAPTADSEEAKAQVAFKDAVMANCLECKVEVTPGKFKGIPEYLITFPNGFKIVVSVDPGVVELQTPALSLEAYKNLSSFIEEAIYTPAKNLGMQIKLEGDGHLNLGVLSAFPKVTQFADFLLDQVNHPELGLGVLGQDLMNAPPLAIQEKEQMEAFAKIMDEVKAGKIRKHLVLAEEINEKVYYKSPDHPSEDKIKEAGHGRHYQAASIKRLIEGDFPIIDAPVELRFNDGRKTFDELLLCYELIIKRIEYLNARPRFFNLQRQPFHDLKNMSPTEKLSRFYIFLAEMGESLDKYRGLLSDPQIQKVHLDVFTKGNFNWAERRTKIETFRYIPDIEISPWVRGRFRKILDSPTVPLEFKNELMEAIEKHAESAKTENKVILDAFLQDVKNPKKVVEKVEKNQKQKEVEENKEKEFEKLSGAQKKERARLEKKMQNQESKGTRFKEFEPDLDREEPWRKVAKKSQTWVGWCARALGKMGTLFNRK